MLIPVSRSMTRQRNIALATRLAEVEIHLRRGDFALSSTDALSRWIWVKEGDQKRRDLSGLDTENA
jgi:hypothetical protein